MPYFGKKVDQKNFQKNLVPPKHCGNIFFFIYLFEKYLIIQTAIKLCFHPLFGKCPKLGTFLLGLPFTSIFISLQIYDQLPFPPPSYVVNSKGCLILVRAECVTCPKALLRNEVSTILVRAKCVRPEEQT